MKRVMTGLIMAALMLCLVGVASAYTILDNETGGDCTQIGTWDAGTKTCTLTADLTEGISIGSDYVTLDGAGHNVNGNLAGIGVYVNGRTGVVIKKLNIAMFENGIYLYAVTNSTVTESNCSNPQQPDVYTYGIQLIFSHGNVLADNFAVNHRHSGITVMSSNGNNILNNVSSDNAWYGIYTSNAFNNVFRENIISDNQYGIRMGLCQNNEFSHNTVEGYWGLIFEQSSNNTIYNNNFMTSVFSGGSGNAFNLSGPVGGNYWSAYDTTSEGCDDANSDFFCDAPYYFGGTDYLPWVVQNGWVDADADGFGIAVDCNDSDPSVNPAASEIPYNGIDENCNGMADDDDLDNDGYGIATDCNDNNATVYPGAVEIKHDGIDQDCNGYDLTIDITKAIYTTRKDRLRVEATSALGAGANLQLVGYGTMTWDGISKWIKTVEPAGGNPGTVTVSGIEGAESAQVTQQ